MRDRPEFPLTPSLTWELKHINTLPENSLDEQFILNVRFQKGFLVCHFCLKYTTLLMLIISIKKQVNVFKIILKRWHFYILSKVITIWQLVLAVILSKA